MGDIEINKNGSILNENRMNNPNFEEQFIQNDQKSRKTHLPKQHSLVVVRVLIKVDKS